MKTDIMKTDIATKEICTTKAVMETLSILTIQTTIEDYKRELSAWFRAYLANEEYSECSDVRADSFYIYEVFVNFLDHLKLLEEKGLNQKILEAGVFDN